MSKPETTILIFGSRRGIVNVADVPAFIEAGIARAVDETKFPEGYCAVVEPLPAGVEPLGPDEKRNEILTHRDGSEIEINHQMRTAGRQIYVATCAEAVGRRMVEPAPVPPPSPEPEPKPELPPSPEAAGADSSPAAPQGVISLAAPLPPVAGRPKPAAPRAGKPSPTPEG